MNEKNSGIKIMVDKNDGEQKRWWIKMMVDKNDE